MATNQYSLRPCFDFPDSGTSILLCQGQVEICIGEIKYRGNGEVRLDLLPSASIQLYGKFKGVSLDVAWMPTTDQNEISSFSINGHQVEGFSTYIKNDNDNMSQEISVKWCPKTGSINGVGDESTQMARIVFHLFNFVDFIGTRHSIEQIGTASHGIEHIDLTHDDWKVELKSLPVTRDNIKALKAEGGYRLTHIGNIAKADGALFSGEEAKDYLKALNHFFSFAKGGWCPPICAVGYDTSDNRVWELWSAPREPWHVALSWFDPHNGVQLATLFPGFMKRWKNADWRGTLQEVMYWYLNANYSSRGIDAGIILAQAALERLSYEFSVRDKHLLTGNGFKSIWASDKLRLLFSSLGIPVEIPKETPGLSSQTNWLDAPHALTEIRNSLVHPEHKNHGELGQFYIEAWKLGLWFLEMSVLAICGYSGNYGNRLKQHWAGQTETVPWEENRV